LEQNFGQVYYLQENVAIDESLIKFRGRLSYIKFNPQKRARFGIKIYRICEPVSGYYLGFSIHTGKKPDQAQTQGILSSEAIVMDLMEPYLQNGHTVFVDNWFSSPSLFLNLAEKKPMQLGQQESTAKTCHSSLIKKMGKGERKVVYSHKMMALLWMHRKPVTILFTCHDDVEMTNTRKMNRKTNMPVIKPKVVID
jgi:hypothetical protein